VPFNLPRRSLVCLILISMIVPAILVLPTYAADKPTITISALNIARHIKEFYLSDGTWVIDPWEKGIGHLEQTGWFDNPTNIVLAGHSMMPNGQPGIFANLSSLAVGQEIVLFDGSADRRYQVVDIRVVPLDDVSVVMPTEQERLTLITCDLSSFDEASQSYTRRLVVMADRTS